MSCDFFVITIKYFLLMCLFYVFNDLIWSLFVSSKFSLVWEIFAVLSSSSVSFSFLCFSMISWPTTIRFNFHSNSLQCNAIALLFLFSLEWGIFYLIPSTFLVEAISILTIILSTCSILLWHSPIIILLILFSMFHTTSYFSNSPKNISLWLRLARFSTTLLI